MFTLARISRARAFAACKVHWTLHLSGSANRGDFSRIMQLEVVDSHNASPLTCCLLLRLFRFGFDLFFWLKFVCRRVSLDYLASAAALILFDQESPSPLTSLNNCV